MRLYRTALLLSSADKVGSEIQDASMSRGSPIRCWNTGQFLVALYCSAVQCRRIEGCEENFFTCSIYRCRVSLNIFPLYVFGIPFGMVHGYGQSQCRLKGREQRLNLRLKSCQAMDQGFALSYLLKLPGSSIYGHISVRTSSCYMVSVSCNLEIWSYFRLSLFVIRSPLFTNTS